MPNVDAEKEAHKQLVSVGCPREEKKILSPAYSSVFKTAAFVSDIVGEENTTTFNC